MIEFKSVGSVRRIFSSCNSKKVAAQTKAQVQENAVPAAKKIKTGLYRRFINFIDRIKNDGLPDETKNIDSLF